VDPLNQCNYPATEIFTQLKAYTLDMTKDDPHVVSDFSKERRLKVMAEFCCKNEPVLNKHLIDQFIGNMLVLQEAFNMFSNVNDIEKFSQAMMNVKEKIMTLDLEQATNFAIEKHLDKINKEILLALKEMSGTNYDKIFNAIILKMRSQYTSFTHYATDIINLNEETFYHLLDQIYRNSDQDKHYQALKNELENHDNFDAVLNDAWKNNKPIAIASLLRCLSMFDPDAALSIKKEVFEWGLQKDHKQLVNGLLVELNNEVDEGGEIYFSPLHIAVRQGKPEIIKEIFTQYRELAKECFASRFNRNGETMLHIAVDGGNNSLVKSLLSCLGSCAAFVNQQRHDGCTPLHLAVSKGKIEMVKALLEQGADPRIANRKNHTSLSIAKSKGNYEIMNLLNNAINTNTAKPNPNRHF
ncbi:MAG: ankyrin repeat domain-containing protein, partial [Gammaproteobacteria bacterium]|nr:ankyrin repeat domain-containing protein [Gammaproteobacteria bacterium]